MRNYFPVISIAGSDSSGGAGIQADIKTISALGCYAMTAITAVTAQNTAGITAIQGMNPEMVRAQIDAAVSDIRPLGVKVGMLYSSEIVTAVAESIERWGLENVVLDPVMVSTSGSTLLEPEAETAMVKRLFPLCELVTPNQRETIELTGETDPVMQARTLFGMGCRNLLIKGGDCAGSVKTDMLFVGDYTNAVALKADAIETRNTHGTGCTLSSAIASYLALGYELTDAVRAAKLYVTRALEAGAFVTAGNGNGPVNHFFAPRRLKNFNPRFPGREE